MPLSDTQYRKMLAVLCHKEGADYEIGQLDKAVQDICISGICPECSVRAEVGEEVLTGT